MGLSSDATQLYVLSGSSRETSRLLQVSCRRIASPRLRVRPPGPPAGRASPPASRSRPPTPSASNLSYSRVAPQPGTRRRATDYWSTIAWLLSFVLILKTHFVLHKSLFQFIMNRERQDTDMVVHILFSCRIKKVNDDVWNLNIITFLWKLFKF